MNIIEARELYTDSEHLKKLDELCNFYKKVGNEVTAGYLGSMISNIRFDDMGDLEFQTLHAASNLETLSTGALLNDGVVIRQIQRTPQEKFFQLFSWNKDYTKYTYVLFDSLMAADIAYDIIKAADTNLCQENVADALRSLRIPIDNILQVKENVEVNGIGKLEFSSNGGDYSSSQSALSAKVI